MGDLGGEEVVTIDDLQQRDVGYCKKGTDVPFTGKTTGQTQGTYKDGKKDGPWVSYHGDGTVDEKDTGTYKNAVRIN